MPGVRATEQAYIKGLNQGYALAEAQYKEIIRDSRESGVTKGQVLDTIELIVCSGCSNYHHGDFCEDCRLCRVSQCCFAVSITNT